VPSRKEERGWRWRWRCLCDKWVIGRGRVSQMLLLLRRVSPNFLIDRRSAFLELDRNRNGSDHEVCCRGKNMCTALI
jgi:hypothetical protein